MFSINHITKTYVSKGGNKTTALNDVSMSFPDRGLFFVLGKSGSGKSTLLNIIGGMDQPDSGDITVDGRSFQDFKKSDYDSYRNSYVGFVFQEYNLLDEFCVGDNIALAVDLLRKSKSRADIENVLKRVDLEGFYDKRINELSGGEKQRVAIARALIKNSRLILADEPTGALDSKTSELVLSILKELSKEKLVIVVSHEEEYADKYSDGIVELSDGKVIKNSIEALPPKSSPADAFMLRGSRLSLRNTLKISLSSFRHKPIVMVFAIILSFISFGLFGIADTLASYDKADVITDSVYESKINYITFQKRLDNDSSLNVSNSDDGDIETIRQKYGIAVDGVYSGTKFRGISLLSSYKNTAGETEYSPFYSTSSPGLLSLRKFELSDLGFKIIAGHYPTKEYEIALTTHLLAGFKEYGYGYEEILDGSQVTDESLIGKKLGLTVGFYKADYLVTGIIDTGFPETKYAELKTSVNTASPLYAQYDIERRYSYHDLIFTDESTVRKVRELDIPKNEASIDYNLGVTSYFPAMREFGETQNVIKTKDELLDDEIIVSLRDYRQILNYSTDYQNVLSGISVNSGTYVESKNLYDFMLSITDIENEPLNGYAESTYDEAVSTGFSTKEYFEKHLASPTNIYNEAAGRDYSVAIYKEYLKSILYDVNPYADESFESYYVKSVRSELRSYEDLLINNLPSLKISGRLPGLTNNLFIDHEMFEIIGVDFSLESGQSYILFNHEMYSRGVIDDGRYSFLIAPLPKDKSITRKVVGDSGPNKYSDMYFSYNTPILEAVKTIDYTLTTVSQAFMVLGVVLAIFSAVLIMAFVSISISHKRSEIGILRTLGAKTKDVQRIFVVESLIMGLSSFALSIVLVFVGSTVINHVLKSGYNIVFSLLHPGIRQVCIILGINLLVSFISTLIPIYRITKKKPIEIVRDR